MKSAKEQVVDAGMACVEAIEWGIQQWGEETLLTNWSCGCRVDNKASVIYEEKYLDIEVYRRNLHSNNEGIYGKLNVVYDKHGKEQLILDRMTFETEIVPKKNGNGFLVNVIVWTARTRFNTRRTQIFYKKMSVVINNTAMGVRYFSMFEGKKYFGMHCIARAANAVGGLSLRWDIEKEVYQKMSQKIQLLDIFPELKWFSGESRFETNLTNIRLTEAMHPFLLKCIGSNAGAKAMVNAAYSPKGEKRVQKDSFGGVGEIRTIGELLNALLWVRSAPTS